MKKFLGIIISAFLVGCGNDPMEDFTEAVKFAEEGDWSKAVLRAKDAADAQPTILTETFYAICLEKQANFIYAQEIMERMANNPKNFKNHELQYICGMMLYNQKKYDQAYKYLLRSFQVNQKNVDCLLALFQISTTRKDEVANQLFKHVELYRELRNSPILLNNYGCYLGQKKDKKAQNYFISAQVSATRAKNVPSEIFFNRAVILDEGKFYKQANDFYRQYLENSSKKDDALIITRRMNELTQLLDLQKNPPKVSSKTTIKSSNTTKPRTSRR